MYLPSYFLNVKQAFIFHFLEVLKIIRLKNMFDKNVLVCVLYFVYLYIAPMMQLTY